MINLEIQEDFKYTITDFNNQDLKNQFGSSGFVIGSFEHGMCLAWCPNNPHGHQGPWHLGQYALRIKGDLLQYFNGNTWLSFDNGVQQQFNDDKINGIILENEE